MKKPISQLTVDELKSKEKTLKTAVGIMVGLMVALIGCLIAILILKGSQPIVISLSVLPITFIIMLISTKKALKDIELEIASRSKV